MSSADLLSDSDESDIEIVEVRSSNEPESQPPREPGERGIKAVKCAVCLDKPEVMAVVPCGHFYCRECVFTSLSCSRRANRVVGVCSICRKPARYDQVIYVEFKIGGAKAGAAPEELADTAENAAAPEPAL